MLREVVSSDKGPHMSLQCIEVWIVKRLYCGVFHRSVHSFGLPIGPWMIWLGQLVLYAMLTADPIKDVPNETRVMVISGVRRGRGGGVSC